jgi:DNA polymerase III sliding clamp (beta) subunit (PCNA family)
MFVTGESTMIGIGKAELEARVEGSGSCLVSGRYLLDALEVLPGRDVRIEFYGDRKPIVVKPGSGAGYWCAIAQMALPSATPPTTQED